jgi:dihydrofolate reductase
MPRRITHPAHAIPVPTIGTTINSFITMCAIIRFRSGGQPERGEQSYVATHRPDSLEWSPVESLGQDIVECVRHFRAKIRPDLILWGSSTLTPMLLEHELADEVLLFVYPVLLGNGKRFFSDGTAPRELALTSTSTKAASFGVLISTYTPAGPLRTGSL